jgi:acetyl-CoA carboxylase biotin carboxyl carrier protein
VAQGREETAGSSPAAGDAADEHRAGTGSDAEAGGAQPTGRSAGESPSWADLEFVRGLIEVVDASGIDSLEITRAGTRVKISKTPPSGIGPAYYAPAPYPAGFPHAGPGPTGAGGGNAAAPTGGPAAGGTGAEAAGVSAEPGSGADANSEAGGLIEVKSPMVGTFYRAPAPEAPPYVEVGTRVSKGQTLCILEAMKLMNELESEVEGVVRQVLVENAEPVEYGQVLFRVDPAG